ncbi:hypothetical protein KI688_004513 [Linnemannia hyalina]|uniref:Mediator of RNA polymerase II transcription subunit 27 n=1 Tax=Linnemannia hyalina TaxID=64524 RepID=A0A9P7XKU1_9FUNG|nr:hypothetical protein KI688_004513 [Linnemannia hyalina]
MTEQEDIAAALEKTQNALHDVELMINSLNDVRLSVHHVFHILQGRSLAPLSGAAFRENAKFTYTALESLAKLAVNSEGLLNDTQSMELPKLQGPSPMYVVSLLSLKKSPAKSLPGVNVSGVMNAFIVLEANRKGRCLSISRLVVFGAGEENSVWEDSSHLVFKKISQIAVGAVDYFMDRAPRSLLGLVLEWISMYSTLFTAPCSGCGKHLYFDSQQFKHLPPTLYTYDEQGMALPFHPACQKK